MFALASSEARAFSESERSSVGEESAVAIPGPAEVVAASELGVVTLNGGVVRVFSPAGEPIRGDSLTGTTERQRHRSRKTPSSEEGPVNDEGEESSESGSTWASTSPFVPNLSAQQEQWGQSDDDNDDDDALGGTQSLRRGHSAVSPNDAPQSNNAIAVGKQFAWLGRGDGLWRIDLRDGTRMRLPEPSGMVGAVSVSPDGAFLVVAIAGRVLLSADKGASFRELGTYAGRRVILAVESSGLVAFIDANGIHTSATLAVTPATSVSSGAFEIKGLAACPEGILAWSQSALFRIVPGDEAARTEGLGPLPPGSHKIFCGTRGDVFAYGTNLWRRTRETHAWSRLSFGPGEIRSLAQAGRLLWVANQTGALPIRLVDLVNPPENSPDDVQNKHQRTVAIVLTAPRRVPGFDAYWVPWWHVLLPRIDLKVWAMHRPSQLAFGVLAFATFTLDPRMRATSPIEHLRTAYLQRETQRAAYAASSEEQQALMRIWRDP